MNETSGSIKLIIKKRKNAWNRINFDDLWLFLTFCDVFRTRNALRLLVTTSRKLSKSIDIPTPSPIQAVNLIFANFSWFFKRKYRFRYDFDVFGIKFLKIELRNNVWIWNRALKTLLNIENPEPYKSKSHQKIEFQTIKSEFQNLC